jgi:hypothetical protein
MEVKIHSFLCVDKLWTVAPRQMKFGTVKDHRHTYKFYLNHYFILQTFKAWQWSEILRLCSGKCWMTVCRIVR